MDEQDDLDLHCSKSQGSVHWAVTVFRSISQMNIHDRMANIEDPGRKVANSFFQRRDPNVIR